MQSQREQKTPDPTGKERTVKLQDQLMFHLKNSETMEMDGKGTT